MKHSNTLFLAATAVLTMSFSIARQQHWFPAKKSPVSISNCYTPTIRILTNNCLNTVALGCNRLSAGAPVSSKAGFSTSVTCDESGNTFCCAQLDVDSQVCPNQLQAFITRADGTLASGYVFVAAVYCKLP